MSIHKTAMKTENSKDVEERINFVVNRFRKSAGPEYYTYKLKYIDDVVDCNPTLMVVIMLALFFIVPYIVLTYGQPWLIALYIGCLTALPLILNVARGRILKKKKWQGDYISDEDILYLCEIVSLKNIIARELGEGVRHTYSGLSDQVDLYIKMIADNDRNKNLNHLISNINGGSTDL